MPSKSLKPVVQEWVRIGCLLFGLGVVAIVRAALTGHQRVEAAIVFAMVFSGLTACFTVGSSLRKMEAPELAGPHAVLATDVRSVAWSLGSLAALFVAAVVFVPGALFEVGCVGVSLGAVWLAAAGTVRYRELRWFDARLVAGERTSRFRSKATSYYLMPFS